MEQRAEIRNKPRARPIQRRERGGGHANVHSERGAGVVSVICTRENEDLFPGKLTRRYEVSFFSSKDTSPVARMMKYCSHSTVITSLRSRANSVSRLVVIEKAKGVAEATCLTRCKWMR